MDQSSDQIRTMIDRYLRAAERHRTILLVLLIGVLTVLAWSNRFIQDDAFIGFRYGLNLCSGDGFTWNPGERIEAYTNFLWTLLMAIPFCLGIDPIHFAYATGVFLLFPTSLWLVDRLASEVVSSPWAGLITVLLLGTNHTFSAFATGGLGTQLNVMLLLWLTLLTLRATFAEPLPASR